MFSYLGTPEGGWVGVGHWLGLIITIDKVYATKCRISTLFVASRLILEEGE